MTDATWAEVFKGVSCAGTGERGLPLELETKVIRRFAKIYQSQSIFSFTFKTLIKTLC